MKEDSFNYEMIDIEISETLKTYQLHKSYSQYQVDKQLIKMLIFKTFPLEDKQWEDLMLT